MVNLVPQVIPTRYEFLECLTENTEWSPEENGTYRVTCIGASSNGTAGGTGRNISNPDHDNSYGALIATYYGGTGGNGGGSGGISRSVLNLKSTDQIHCTINSSISSFGDSLSATAGSGVTPGIGSGGNDFNIDGNTGGSGGKGGYHKALNGYPSDSNTTRPSSGSKGGGNGASPGTVSIPESYIGEGGGGGGGGASYSLPENIGYDDPLYTTYIQPDLSAYKGGNGGVGRSTAPTAASTYPSFSALAPTWYGGGNGGGGGRAMSKEAGTAGTAGSPGGILIEKGFFD